MKKRLSYFGRVQWRESDDGSVASTDPVNVDFPSIKIRIMFADLLNNKISIMFADLLNNKIRIMFADLLNNKIRGSLLTCSTTRSGESVRLAQQQDYGKFADLLNNKERKVC